MQFRARWKCLLVVGGQSRPASRMLVKEETSLLQQETIRSRQAVMPAVHAAEMVAMTVKKKRQPVAGLRT